MIKLTPAQRTLLEVVAGGVVVSGMGYGPAYDETTHRAVRTPSLAGLERYGLVKQAAISTSSPDYSSAKTHRYVLTDLGRSLRDAAPVSVPTEETGT